MRIAAESIASLAPLKSHYSIVKGHLFVDARKLPKLAFKSTSAVFDLTKMPVRKLKVTVFRAGERNGGDRDSATVASPNRKGDFVNLLLTINFRNSVANWSPVSNLIKRGLPMH